MSDELRAAVEWMSVEDTLRMVRYGDRHAIDGHNFLPEAKRHHDTLAAASDEEIERMCAVVEIAGTGNKGVLDRIPSGRGRMRRIEPRPDLLEEARGGA